MDPKKKILIVEDDPDLRTFYSTFLSETYLTDAAADGEEGWSKATANNYDLILLDIMMPKLDGIGFLKRRKDDAKIKKIPVVMMSNLGKNEVLEECFSLGVKYYIIKAESTPDQIAPTIEKALQDRA
jgi:CheY-like chemotaxis protein